MKYAWMDTYRDQFALNALYRVLKVSVSGNRAWKRSGSANRQGLTDSQLLTLIEAIHAEFKGAYGAPRMVRAAGTTLSGESGTRRATAPKRSTADGRAARALMPRVPSARPTADGVSRP
ncbi:hypothetical protein [Thiocystis violacea]|uniref:hypothetical protein n=1 Tax=Thiocystis violacea TaxID=13725 RepID=UPI00190805C4